MQWELQKKAGFGFKESYGDKLKSKVFDPISKFYKKKLTKSGPAAAMLTTGLSLGSLIALQNYARSPLRRSGYHRAAGVDSLQKGLMGVGVGAIAGYGINKLTQK